MVRLPKRPTPPPIKTPKRATPVDAIPRIIAGPVLADHLEVMTRAIFQAGLSWAIIAARWPAFVTAFEHFEPGRVAAYDDADLERLMATDGIIHSAKKISGTFANARALLEIEREHGAVSAYASTFETYASLYADAHRRFAFLGDLSCYYWLFRTGNAVPLFDDWIARQPTDHPRMREMVMLARETGGSPERPGF